MKGKSNSAFEALYAKAHEAGMAAVASLNVVPMVVQQHADMTDDSSPVAKSWYVADGVCGFAWVTTNGNSAFGRWAKAEKGWSKGYPKGVSMWVSQFNQSYQKKYAYAGAFAATLQSGGVQAYAGGRLD